MTIGIGDVRARIEHLNTITPGSPEYVIARAYGGTAIHQFTDVGSSSIRDLTGYRTKREAWDWLGAYIAGIGTGRVA